MDKGEFALQAIATVGFPIFMSCVLLALLYIVMKDHKEEVKMLTKAIDACTSAVEELTIYIRNGGNNK